MDKLIREHARMGIYMIGDFGAYYYAFYTISAFLVQKNRMSQAEQSRLVIKGLSTDLWHKIFTRLSIKEPDHDPDDFWPLEDRKAGEYVSNRTNLPVLPMGMGISSNLSFSSGLMVGANNVLENVVKKEGLAGMFEKFTQQLVSTLVAKNSNELTFSNNGNSSFKRNCHFCGSVSHLLPACDIVEQTIKEGKCIRNHEGRLVLPGGGYLPRSIHGKTMLDRFEEWHHQNLGQLAKEILFSSMVAGMLYDCVLSSVLSDSA